MEILIGFILYLIVVMSVVSFGKFLKECDDSLLKGMKNETTNRKRLYYPARNLFWEPHCNDFHCQEINKDVMKLFRNTVYCLIRSLVIWYMEKRLCAITLFYQELIGKLIVVDNAPQIPCPSWSSFWCSDFYRSEHIFVSNR